MNCNTTHYRANSSSVPGDPTKVAKISLAEDKTIREVVIERGYIADGKLTEADLDKALDVLAMTHPATD